MHSLMMLTYAQLPLFISISLHKQHWQTMSYMMNFSFVIENHVDPQQKIPSLGVCTIYSDIEWCEYKYLHYPQLQISIHLQSHVVCSCLGCHLESRTMVCRLHLLYILPQGYYTIWEPCRYFICRQFN